MKYLIRNILIPIKKNVNLKKKISKIVKLNPIEINSIEVKRKSLDSRQKNRLKYNFTCIIETSRKVKTNNQIIEYSEKNLEIKPEKRLNSENPIIIGAGPAGLFAALQLVENGFKPYIFEKGDPIEERKKQVDKFWQKAILDPESNVQFGEGGAGTFSDAKLTARNRNIYTNKVFEYLIKFGADEKISYQALPHLGTDGIHKIILKIRQYLQENGAKFFWRHSLNEISLKQDKIYSVKINNEIYKPEIVFLGIGNASRATFALLHKNKIAIENKPFAIGFRIEHPQEYLNKSFYGAKTDFSITGAANYKLKAKFENRGIYSFCMCPGGFVVASASEKNQIITNGMSFSKRRAYWGNSAIVTTVNEKDYGTEILNGMKFQQKIEQKAFNLSSSYFAPAQKSTDYLTEKVTTKKFKHSYKPDISLVDINQLFSPSVNQAFKFALKKFDKQYKGFINNSHIIAPETRTSSPIRILRNRKSLASISAKNLFPIGEGAGYAGGIISSAADGIRAASRFYK